jgi:RecA-family ATPase
MLTTTTRMMLVAPTGLGKTNIALAMAVAVALGRDFLHWRGAGRPRRELYVDGEMSQRLMKQRIIDAARRAGMGEELSAEDLATLQANLFVVNHADFPDLAPLNTAAGQHFVDELIEQLGGVDLTVFDNIQALTTKGDSLDPAEWQQVLPWAKHHQPADWPVPTSARSIARSVKDNGGRGRGPKV